MGDENFVMCKEIIRAARSQKDSLNIPRQTPPFFASLSSQEARTALEMFAGDFCILVGAESLTIVDSEADVPRGCTINVVSSAITLFMNVEGLVDFAAEVTKLEKQANETNRSKDQLERKMNAPGYAEKANPAVQAKNLEKLAAFEAKLAGIARAIADFRRMG